MTGTLFLGLVFARYSLDSLVHFPVTPSGDTLGPVLGETGCTIEAPLPEQTSPPSGLRESAPRRPRQPGPRCEVENEGNTSLAQRSG